MSCSEAGSQYCKYFISMVTPNKIWPFIQHEFGRMLVLIQVYRGACV